LTFTSNQTRFEPNNKKVLSSKKKKGGYQRRWKSIDALLDATEFFYIVCLFLESEDLFVYFDF
jgi:hypothetical protein